VLSQGWYRLALAYTVAALALIAAVAAAVGGTDTVLWVGLGALAVGLASLAMYKSPWLEQDWPLDSKDGLLVTGGLLGTAGTLVSVVGLLLRL